MNALIVVLRNQNNYESVHILHNDRGGMGGGSLKCLCMIMGDGEVDGLVMTDANDFFYKSHVFH